MAKKSNPHSLYVLNVGAFILMLSVIGSTLRFMVISVTLVSWLQNQWLKYTSFLKKRQSVRLVAATNEARTYQRKQKADIFRLVGENVVLLLDKRQEQTLKLNQEAEKKRRESEKVIVARIVEHLARFQESERIKGQQLEARELDIILPEVKIKEKEETLQAVDFNPVAPPIKYTLPSDLERYSLELGSHLNYNVRFTCIGVTKKGARCGQDKLSYADKRAAAARIEQMQLSNLGNTFEMEALRELADWLLCPLWHRYKIPQGETIASRWYYEERCLKAKLENQTQTHTNKLIGFETPSSEFGAFSTPSSSGVSSIFSNNSTGIASSVSSTQSGAFTGSCFQLQPPRCGACRFRTGIRKFCCAESYSYV